MKLIWHIIRKDIVRDRWALLVWALLFVAQVGIGFMLLHEVGWASDWLVQLQLASVALVFLQVTMGYFLVARLVHADALLGTDVFWLTRPVSAARLFAAKALGALLLFAVLPVLLLLPWWLACGFGLREIGWAALDTIGWQLLMIAPAFLVATLTDDLGRVFLWTLLMVIGLMSWLILLRQPTQLILFHGLSDSSGFGAGVFFTRLWLCGVILAGGGMLIAAHHFLTRHLVRSVVLVVFGLGLIALVGQVWPWNWAETFANADRPAGIAAPVGLAESLTFNVDTAKVAGESRNRSMEEPRVNVTMWSHGVPEDMGLTGEVGGEQTWLWPSGLSFGRGVFLDFGRLPAFPMLRKAYALPVPTDDPETDQWRRARNEKTRAERIARGYMLDNDRGFVLNPPPPSAGVPIMAYGRLPGSIIAKIRQEPPAYRASVSFILTRPEIVMELPLQVDARGFAQSRLFHLTRLIEKDSQPLVAMVLTTEPAVRENGLWFADSTGRNQLNFSRKEVLAVNHVTGEIRWVGNSGRGNSYAVIGGVVLRWNAMNVGTRSVIRLGAWRELDPEWRKHTTLVFVAEKVAARFTREIKADKFELAPSILDRINGAAGAGKPLAKP